jgi:LacI family transcriptional regulator, repressor for deo operon, udp, cdd, tsx, nupC, and nupG
LVNAVVRETSIKGQQMANASDARSLGGAKKRKRRTTGSSGVTMVDVARAARVSSATISRVLSGSDNVSEATRKNVLEVIAKLNYSPNASAQRLRTMQTNKILVIVPDILSSFFTVLLQSIEEAAIREGFAVLVGDTQHQFERDVQYATMLPRKEVDGLIVLSQKVPVAIRSWMASYRGMPPVVTGFTSGRELGISSAGVDNEAAATEAVGHLYGLGHKRIGVCTGAVETPQMQQRLRGIRAEARRRSALQGLSVEQGKFSVDSGIASATRLLAQPQRPTAMVCFSDDLALGAMEAARRLGIGVPKQLSIIGFDDLPVSAYLNPPLTTMAMPMRDVGRETVRLLVGRLRGHIDKPVSVVLPCQLVHRGSTAAFQPSSF